MPRKPDEEEMMRNLEHDLEVRRAEGYSEKWLAAWHDKRLARIATEIEQYERYTGRVIVAETEVQGD